MRPAGFAAGCVIGAVLSVVATPAVAAPRLDARFGDGGVQRVSFKFDDFREWLGALRPVRQADGKVLVAAQVYGERDPEEVVLARFERSGALDTTFGRRGRVRIKFSWQFVPVRVLAQRDGRILLVGVVGGYSYFSYRSMQIGVVRLLPDGSRDRSFGTNGFVAWNPPWHAGEVAMDILLGLALPQPGGRLLVTATVDERALGVYPEVSWHRVVLVRFGPDGSVDQSFGRGGFAELDWDDSYFLGWALLADGRIAALASRHEGAGEPTLESTAWWLHTFAVDGSSGAGLRSAGSVRLGLDVLDELKDLVPIRDNRILMVGDVDIDQPGGPVAAVRRIRPDGSLDPAFGRHCNQPPLRARTRGGAVTSRGGMLATAWRLLIHARPRRFDSWVIPYDSAGCVAATPLRLRGLIAGPPLAGRHGHALVSASYGHGLALIKIRP